jgi:hypothetical protein
MLARRPNGGSLAVDENETAFIDGRREAHLAIYRSLVEPYAPLLDRLLGPADDLPLSEVQLGALDFTADHGRFTRGLPPTVTMIDRSAACENLIDAVHSSAAAATEVFAL